MLVALPLTLREVGTVRLAPPPMPPDPSLLRIGTLARRSGLTVRALRHYDEAGLLPPVGRSPAGHRLYDASSVARLLQVVALRTLGLPLRAIREVLDTADPLRLLEQHRDRLRARADEAARLADAVDRVADALRRREAPTSDALFSLIHLTTMFEKHYTPEQMAQLREREAALSPDAVAETQRAWAELFEAFDRHRVAGVSPDDAVLAPLVAEARTLIGAFTGGDAELGDLRDTCKIVIIAAPAPRSDRADGA